MFNIGIGSKYHYLAYIICVISRIADRCKMNIISWHLTIERLYTWETTKFIKGIVCISWHNMPTALNFDGISRTKLCDKSYATYSCWNIFICIFLLDIGQFQNLIWCLPYNIYANWQIRFSIVFDVYRIHFEQRFHNETFLC